MMGENKRLFILLGVGLALVGALLGYQLMSSGDDGGSKRVVAVPTPVTRALPAAPGAPAPAPSSTGAASAGGPATTARPSSPSPVPTTVARPARDPFAANF